MELHIKLFSNNSLIVVINKKLANVAKSGSSNKQTAFPFGVAGGVNITHFSLLARGK